MEQPIKDGKIKKSKRTQNKIVDSLLSLMSDKSWDKISVKELCAKAEITRGTFYQYYDDIYNLMESLETALLEDFTQRCKKIHHTPYSSIPTEHFIEKYNYAPPKMFLTWFEFCRDHHHAMAALLDHKRGNAHFVERIKQILREHINDMMDGDGHANDDLRTPFVNLMLEMHLLSAQIWLENGETDFLPIDDIVNLLNATRVGSSYLSYKRRSDPNFNRKMSVSDTES